MIHVKLKNKGENNNLRKVPDDCSSFRFKYYPESRWRYAVKAPDCLNSFVVFIHDEGDDYCGMSVIPLNQINVCTLVWEPCDIEIKVGKIGE